MDQCRCNSVAAKKPLALLVSWLRQGKKFDCRATHRDSRHLISMEERRKERRWLLEQPELRRLLELEAEWSGTALGEIGD